MDTEDNIRHCVHVGVRAQSCISIEKISLFDSEYTRLRGLSDSGDCPYSSSHFITHMTYTAYYGLWRSELRSACWALSTLSCPCPAPGSLITVCPGPLVSFLLRNFVVWVGRREGSFQKPFLKKKILQILFGIKVSAGIFMSFYLSI